MKPSPALHDIAGAPLLEWLREEFGSLERVVPLITRFRATTKDDAVALLAAETPDEAAALLHRISGGLRVFGPSRLAREMDELEATLRSGDGYRAMARLPALVTALDEFVVTLDAATRVT